MWKRDEGARQPQPSAPAPAPAAPVHEPVSQRVEPVRAQERERERPVPIGKSVVIKGDLTGSEDLTIEGQVEGRIELRQNVLTIGTNGKIHAELFAKIVVVQGEVHGNITASERIEIRDAGSVDGDLSAPRVAIADGAHFRGSIDMQRAGAKTGEAPKAAAPDGKAAEPKPQPKPAATPTVAIR